jgi:hypothetical protein
MVNIHGGWNLVPLTECDEDTDILLWIEMPRVSCEIVGNAIEHEKMFKCCCVGHTDKEEMKE